MNYLLQQGDFLSKEKIAVKKCAREFTSCAYEHLEKWISEYDPRDYIPMGTVEYTQRFCELAGIKLPDNISYPPELRPYLHRRIRVGKFSDADADEFVKPLGTKVFTGAVKRELTEAVDNAEEVWISEPVEFSAEFRYYIVNRQVVGSSRYDDGDDPVLVDSGLVEEMVSAYSTQPVGYSIDVGLVDGQTVLVEVNDGWALGLYTWGTMTDAAYVELITRRWQQIIKGNNER